MKLQPETITANDMINELYLLHLDRNAFSDDATEEVEKQIEDAVSKETYYQLEPLVNEIFDIGAREGFTAGFKAAITLLQEK